jgi:hypothetical protein
MRNLREEVRQVLVQYHRKLNNFVMWAEEETKKSAQRHVSPAQLQSTTHDTSAIRSFMSDTRLTATLFTQSFRSTRRWRR